MPVRVKICGITRVEDALAAVRAGASALGFVFYSKSPRYISFATAQHIIQELPPMIAKVGVFVDAPASEVRHAITECGLDTLQFHGEEDPDYCQSFRPVKVIKAFRVRDRRLLESLPAYRAGVDAWLLDSYAPDRLGGTGEVFQWDLAVEAAAWGRPVVLAGGLHPGNVAEAMAKVRPFAVDVSSGVESAPGIKDETKMAAFVQAALA